MELRGESEGDETSHPEPGNDSLLPYTDKIEELSSQIHHQLQEQQLTYFTHMEQLQEMLKEKESYNERVRQHLLKQNQHLLENKQEMKNTIEVSD